MRRPLAASIALLAVLAAGAAAAVLPVRAELVATGASSPVDIVHAPGDAARVFVVEQPGRIRILRNGVFAATPFLDMSALVAYGGERGLLGLAFAPDFAASRRFFVDYTRAGDGATVIASFRASAADPDRVDPTSMQVLLTIAQPFENHNGGGVRFGPDGLLYIGMGDGGSANDPGNRAQDPGELLGKMLRIDVNGAAPYAIPPDNAFAQNGLGRPEIWALGLRNPWRFSFDRVTGDLFIGDVGQDRIEEIDFLPRGAPAGANFGWRVVEGDRCTGLTPGAPCPSTAFVAPILAYPHDPGCSVTGGVVYRGRRVPVLYGRYLYGDYCSGQIFAAARDGSGQWRTELVLDADQRIGTFGEDADGEVYWSDLATGAIYRFGADTVTPLAIEYVNAALGHYFLTAFPEEAAALDGGAFAGAWRRTGYALAAFDPGETGAVDVCRFFGTPVGPNSHFYTGDPAECASLKANPFWRFEAIGFRMRLPDAGACPLFTRPVYRLYNNPATVGAVNHRFTTDGATYMAMQASGWIGEGVALCAK